MYGVKLKTMKTQGTDNPEVFGTICLLQTVPRQQGQQALESTFTYKLVGGNDLGKNLTPDLDLNIEDMEVGFGDSLGDASMDCFTDLNSILEPNFLGQEEENREEEERQSVTFHNLQPAAVKPQEDSFSLTAQDPFMVEKNIEENFTSDLTRLSVSVGLRRSRTPSLDHDYSTKRARLSPSVASPSSVDTVDDPFIVPEAGSPESSTGPDQAASSGDDRRKLRREKNNLASKRSRETRKLKFVNMELEASKLVEENACLEQRVAELEKLAQHMKEVLVGKLRIQT